MTVTHELVFIIANINCQIKIAEVIRVKIEKDLYSFIKCTFLYRRLYLGSKPLMCCCKLTNICAVAPQTKWCW